ncbi:hypothetical protein B0H14DRAFT_3427283 [Mycena olivaceomarginata]|nr:hypothetical protein B0H14DRAFT_3427283 [Mycena olivaceomarginata]
MHKSRMRLMRLLHKVSIMTSRRRRHSADLDTRVKDTHLLYTIRGDPSSENAKACGGKKISTKEKRWYKDVGLGFKTPAEAINGSYIDKKCPFTGDISIRDRILTGKVVSTMSTKMTHHYHPEGLPPLHPQIQHKNLAAHVSPTFPVEIGDVVKITVQRRSFQVLRGVEEQAAPCSSSRLASSSYIPQLHTSMQCAAVSKNKAAPRVYMRGGEDAQGETITLLQGAHPHVVQEAKDLVMFG